MKKLITLIIAATFMLNSAPRLLSGLPLVAGQWYLSSVAKNESILAKEDALRPVATAVSLSIAPDSALKAFSAGSPENKDDTGMTRRDFDKGLIMTLPGVPLLLSLLGCDATSNETGKETGKKTGRETGRETGLDTIATLIEGNISDYPNNYDNEILSPVSPTRALPGYRPTAVRGGTARGFFRGVVYGTDMRGIIGGFPEFSLDAYNKSSSPFWKSIMGKVGSLTERGERKLLEDFYKRLQRDFDTLIKCPWGGVKHDYIMHSRIHIGIIKDLDRIVERLNTRYPADKVEKWRISTERLLETFFGWYGHAILIPDGRNAYRPLAHGGMYHEMHFIPVDPKKIPPDLKKDLVKYTPRLPDYRNYWLSIRCPRPETTAETPGDVVWECTGFFLDAWTESKKEDSLIDLGCGELLPMYRLMREGFRGTIEGYDYSEAMVKKARKNIRDHFLFDAHAQERIKVFKSDITTKEFRRRLKGRRFNMVTMIDVLQDLPPDKVKPTVEWVVKSLLDSKGKLFISVLTANERKFVADIVEKVLVDLKDKGGLKFEKSRKDKLERTIFMVTKTSSAGTTGIPSPAIMSLPSLSHVVPEAIRASA